MALSLSKASSVFYLVASSSATGASGASPTSSSRRSTTTREWPTLMTSDTFSSKRGLMRLCQLVGGSTCPGYPQLHFVLQESDN